MINNFTYYPMITLPFSRKADFRLKVILTWVLSAFSTITAAQDDTIDYTNLIRGNDDDFAKVFEARPFIFPQDHGSHPEYRIEWWYITGNLEEDSNPNNQWGYQITFFRFALASDTTKTTKPDWQSEQIYSAHFAVTDFQHQQHYQFERFSRSALRLAGAQHTPFSVWLDNWELSSTTSNFFPLSLNTLATDNNTGQVALNLSLNSDKPMVLQGDRGFSAKSKTPGNASHYYSYTRLNTTGTVTIGDKTFTVKGSSWLDREWGSSSLDNDQKGWDWFALQFDDNQELMYYRLRTNNSEQNYQHPSSRGVWVNRDGTKIDLSPNDVTLSPLEYWSYNSEQKYPVYWQLKIPKLNVDLKIKAVINDQLWKQQLQYWEGAMIVSGSHTGRGYLELSGY